MSLAHGRSYLAIPGPSVMPERVLAAMHRSAPNIYEGDLVDLTGQVVADLRRVALSTSHVAIYICNGHGTWEASIANIFSRGDKVLSLQTGRFGQGWAAQAEAMGVTVEALDFGLTTPVDPNRVEAALRADTGHDIKAVFLTHVDTATSIRNDVAAVRAAMDAAGHPALLAVDCIASLACDAFRFDDWGVDVMIAASQKGLMVPPGLGFVWVSDKALAVSRSADLRTPYWDWAPRIAPDFYYQHFCGTAPTHHLFGMAESLKMILDEEGLPHVWARHQALARAVAAAFEAWGQGGDLALNVADPAFRAGSVTAARIGQGGAERLRRWCEAEAGVTLGIGLGMAAMGSAEADDFLRVAHMGHVNAHMTLGVLAVMEAGLQALNIPHGAGGIQAAAAVVAAGA
ncbi:alanine-glyoxylate transaminase/serine-glyoxylate transaminase/serine-pyruvate transaminase [Rhodobacter sp. JA431]|uniref:pyridoxal-phosphate-dependent aminotransferase family protein n=1 Tax=Rhodobacter sp. JA431 TaxID=570013 RepID=UPI000BCE6713|nr:aminotransferase class V-fold PLP-dependent enzyme [Rhodobacter sp. JA431]SOC11142.1 alanine-glyoxylate transaminase/serine-glyoxylate transaminase/serine-pyruvate transaminase [Rhodobacter sp. JA431]